MTAVGGWQWAQGSFMAMLAPQTQGALLALGTRRRFPTGRRLFREGEHTDHIEVLLQGLVKVTAIADDVDALLSIRVAGDVVGETAGLTGRPRTATVIACGEIYVSTVSHANFERFLERYPEAAVRMAAMISERLRWANVRRTDFTAYPAEVRLGRLLFDLAQHCGRPVGGGIMIDVPLSQRELATMIGVSNATLQNAIRDLKARHVIETGYRRIVVIDMKALADC